MKTNVREKKDTYLSNTNSRATLNQQKIYLKHQPQQHPPQISNQLKSFNIKALSKNMANNPLRKVMPNANSNPNSNKINSKTINVNKQLNSNKIKSNNLANLNNLNNLNNINNNNYNHRTIEHHNKNKYPHISSLAKKISETYIRHNKNTQNNMGVNYGSNNINNNKIYINNININNINTNYCNTLSNNTPNTACSDTHMKKNIIIHTSNSNTNSNKINNINNININKGEYRKLNTENNINANVHLNSNREINRQNKNNIDNNNVKDNIDILNNDIFLKKILSMLNSLKSKSKKKRNINIITDNEFTYLNNDDVNNIDNDNENKNEHKEIEDDDSDVFDILQDLNTDNRNSLKDLELKINKIILGCNYNNDEEYEKQTGIEYEINNIISLSKMRVDIYKKYFDFIYDLLTDIKNCAQNEIINNNNNNNNIDHDLNMNLNNINLETPIEKNDKIPQIENYSNTNIKKNNLNSLNNSFSQFISSIGNDFYLDLINDNNFDTNNNLFVGTFSFEVSKTGSFNYCNFNSPKCLNFKTFLYSPINNKKNVFFNNKIKLLNNNINTITNITNNKKESNKEYRENNLLDTTPKQFLEKKAFNNFNGYRKDKNNNKNSNSVIVIEPIELSCDEKTVKLNECDDNNNNNNKNNYNDNSTYKNETIIDNDNDNYYEENSQLFSNRNINKRNLNYNNFYGNINQIHPNQILNYINKHSSNNSNINNKIVNNINNKVKVKNKKSIDYINNFKGKKNKQTKQLSACSNVNQHLLQEIDEEKSINKEIKKDITNTNPNANTNNCYIF